MPAHTMVTPAIQAAQRGKGIHKWVNDETASGSLQVLTDATLYHDLSDSEIVMITQLWFDVETASKNCTFDLVKCAAAAGAGAAVTLCGQRHIFTAATRARLLHNM